MAKTIGETSAGFVLHSYPYLETSLIVEMFTRSHGRVVAVAKGAKRPTSAMKSRLNPFQGLLLTWFGKSDLKTLKTVEHAEIYAQLSGAALMSAFYMNELLLKLVQREDAHEALYDAYEDAIVTLVSNIAHAELLGGVATALRKFEMSLLSELGYALQLTEEAGTHDAIDADKRYVYVMERGPISIRNIAKNSSPHAEVRYQSGSSDGLQLSGKTLLDLASGDFSDPQTQTQAKLLMRRAINQLLGDKPLHTRQLIRDLKDI